MVAPGTPWRVRGSDAFAALGRTPHRARRGAVWVAWVPAGTPRKTRVAYAVGRKAGGAVVRNRIRRRLRAAVATTPLPEGDLLVGIAGDAAGLGFPELQAAVGNAVSAVVRTPGR